MGGRNESHYFTGMKPEIGELRAVPLDCQTLRLWKIRHFRPSRARIILGAGVATILGSFPATAADGLRIMSLDVSKAPAIQTPAAQAQEKPSWRTSFGSERESKPIPKAAVPGLDADVVLLQGVTNLKDLSRVFPGRWWKVVVSRQMVLTDDPVDPRSYEAVSNEPATAVAVRYQAGLRIAGQDHFLEHSQPRGIASSRAERLVAGTAVRLNIGGRFVWVASVAFTHDCADSSTPCLQRDALETWRQNKLASGEAVIAGGLRQVTIATGAAASDCDTQSISVAPARKDAAHWTAPSNSREGLGCLATAETGRQAPALQSLGSTSAGTNDKTP
jgi:hypothetical protein